MPGTKDRVIVVSAPSGGGKTTLNRWLVARHPEIEISISVTTRDPRGMEKDGVDYYFRRRDEFRQAVELGEFLEWAEVHGNLYGTTKSELARIWADRRTPLLEIDVQGWAAARKFLPNCLAIFILPPTLKQLWERLEARGSDSFNTRLRRLQNAVLEIGKCGDYDYFIINDQLQRAQEALEHIVINLDFSGSLSRADALQHQQKLIDEFHGAPWLRPLI